MQDPKRVLIVEDDFLVQEKLHGLLRELGYTVVGETSSGQRAVQLAKSLRPDLVMMDIQLDDLDGMTAARQINARCPTPIVALTAYESPELTAEAGEVGIGYYLVKPATRSEIARAITIAAARFEDMQTLRQLNIALRESEERYALAQRAANMGSWDWDIRTGQLYWSERIEPMFGLAAGKFGGTYADFLDYVHPEDRQGIQEAVAHTLEEGADYAVEHRVVWPDGTVHWFSEVGDVIRDAQGTAVRMLGVVQDITDRKEAEQALAYKAQELEQFAYIVSHDLKEPLRMVKSFLELLRKRCGEHLDAKAEEYIRFAVDGAERMGGLIDSLLTYARVDTRDETFMPIACDTILKQVLHYLRFEIEKTDAQVTADPLPAVLGDKTQLIQLFQNLIGNALKFQNEGQVPSVHISASREGVMWHFAVRDNGIGIDPQQFERLFRVFQRLHTREEYEGTGIGLAISKKIVERHGGDIWIESEVGEGTTFHFTLPGASLRGGSES